MLVNLHVQVRYVVHRNHVQPVRYESCFKTKAGLIKSTATAVTTLLTGPCERAATLSAKNVSKEWLQNLKQIGGHICS